jgi:hypothetical protein
MAFQSWLWRLLKISFIFSLIIFLIFAETTFFLPIFIRVLNMVVAMYGTIREGIYSWVLIAVLLCDWISEILIDCLVDSSISLIAAVSNCWNNGLVVT